VHAGGGVAAKCANSKRVDYRVSTATARKCQAMPAGKFPPGISRQRTIFCSPPRVIWCLAGSHPLLKPLPPVRIRRSEVGETLREITALGKSQPTLLHFRGSRLSALVGRLVGRTLGIKRPVETQLGLLTELLKHRTRPSSFEPAYDTRANLLTA
jgi:hypothetical protein